MNADLECTKTLERANTLESAILDTLAYADVFDYPLTVAELHRYLHARIADRAAVENCVQSSEMVRIHDGFVVLPGRENLVRLRQERNALAKSLWPRLRYYANHLANIPFVRMVGITGSLAVGNAKENADYDYMLVVSTGRLWLCRAMVMILVRQAAFAGETVCPNFIIAENNLTMRKQDMYGAHELAQMIPIMGTAVYWRLRAANAWSAACLPNAQGAPVDLSQGETIQESQGKRFLEKGLALRLWDRLENWEMARKIKKFRSLPGFSDETIFTADICQGHFGGYGKATMKAYKRRQKADI